MAVKFKAEEQETDKFKLTHFNAQQTIEENGVNSTLL